MNELVRNYFTKNEELDFQDVQFLSELPDLAWDQVSMRCPDIPRGWFELSRVSAKDRIDFTRDFWLDRIPYHPKAHPSVYEFFEQLDDVGVVLYRMKGDEFLTAELVYSLEDNGSFFRGKVPCSDEDLQELKTEIGISLPRDYLSFARIHNGFGKLSEMGLLEVGSIAEARRRVVNLLVRAEERVKSGSVVVDPGSLIPFFEALGLSSFQCFYADWYPGSEMGNVYLSGIDYIISDVSDKKAWGENLAFSTFTEWLSYYLEGMDLCI